LLGRGDSIGADRQLAAILAAYPTSSVIDQVLYDRARLAVDRGAWRDARADLDQLLAIADSPLAEPAHYLACRVARASHDASAARCFTDYRATYPHSPHDLDVLALLIQLGYADGGCAAVRASLATLVASYPNAAPTRAWQARCPTPEHR
jgi:outer membrane protein assembly factor BamD (BamD/ComL family)